MNRQTILSILMVSIGLSLLGKSFYMQAKADLAQVLIDYSWAQQVKNQSAQKPWPWADTWAVAKIEMPRLGIKQFIMQDASGESLAFGAGRVLPSAEPGNPGHSIIAGHRDSHFAFLEHAQLNDVIEVTHYLGQYKRYYVSDIQIIDSSVEQLIYSQDDNLLTLITCYPFDSIVPVTDLRMVIHAKAQDMSFKL